MDKLTPHNIRSRTDEELREIIKLFGRRGPLAWAVGMAEDELEVRKRASCPPQTNHP